MHPIEELSEEVLKKIRKVFGEDPDKLTRYLCLFKEWLRSEKHLPQDIDDQVIKSFITLCKYDLEKAKSKFEKYIIGKHSLEHLRDDFVLDEKCFEQDDIFRSMVIAPELSEDLTRAIYFLPPGPAERFNYRWRQKYIVDLAEWLLHTVFSMGTGVVLIADLENFTARLLSKLDFTTERRFQTLLISAFPAIVKQVHFINVPSAAKPFFAIFRAVVSEKMKGRIIVHENLDSLKKYFPEDTLPVEFFGTSGKSAEAWGKAWESFYLTTEQVQVKARTMKLCGEIPKNKAHLDPSSGFGASGSFRQLQLD